MLRFKCPSVLKQAQSASTAAPQSTTQKITEDLPILKYRDEIIEKINNNQVTIIAAATGSGKVRSTVQILKPVLIPFSYIDNPSSAVHHR